MQKPGQLMNSKERRESNASLHGKGRRKELLEKNTKEKSSERSSLECFSLLSSISYRDNVVYKGKIGVRNS